MYYLYAPPSKFTCTQLSLCFFLTTVEPLKTKAHLMKTIFWPILCYQCQTWSITAANEWKIITTEMWCLRRAAGVTIKDKIRNEEIKRKLDVKPVMQFIKEQQIKWFGQLTILPWYRLPQRATRNKYNEYKARGRPRKRWSDCIKNNLKKMNNILQSALEQTHTRSLHPPPPPHTSIKK